MSTRSHFQISKNVARDTHHVYHAQRFLFWYFHKISKYGKKSVPVAQHIDIGKKSVPKNKKIGNLFVDFFLKNVVRDIHDYMWWTSSNEIKMITCEIHTHYNIHQESFSNIKKHCAWYTSLNVIKIITHEIHTHYNVHQESFSNIKKRWAWYTSLNVMNIIECDRDHHMWDPHILQYPSVVIFKYQKTLGVIYIIKCDRDDHMWDTHTLQYPPVVIFKHDVQSDSQTSGTL